MSYQLGIDFGTTFLAAAVRRSDGPAEPVALHGDDTAVPAALHLARDGRVRVGEDALRLAGIDAGRVVRAVKQRVGDPAPVVLGGTGWSAEALAARLVGWVVNRVADREGGPAAAVVLAHPATWTPATLLRLDDALSERGVAVTFLPEPLAAAAAAAGAGRVGDPVVVYDLGGGRCDVTVLRRTADAPGFAVVGRPESVVDGGGLDLDERVCAHVLAAAPQGTALDARVRRACVRAKETLSVRTEIVIRAGQGEGRVAVRLDRADFEDLIAPAVAATLTAARRTTASAGLGAGEHPSVLLTGGGARIPLVARMVADELGRPVIVVDDPELLVARGAALVAPAPAGGHASLPASEAGGAELDSRTAAAPGRGEPTTVELRVPPRPASAPAAVPGAPVPAAVPDAPVPAATPAVPVSPAAVPAAALTAPVADVPVPAGAPAAPVAPVAVPAAALPAPVPAGAPAVPMTAGAPTVPVAAAAPAAAVTALVPAAVPDRGQGPAAPAGREPVAASGPDEPVAPAAPRRYRATRPPAVLDSGSRRRGRRRSLSRLLAGAGAVVVAALALVALFRPDGPLDPPTEVAGPVSVRPTGPPAAPAPPVVEADVAGPGPGAPPVRIRPLTDEVTLAPPAPPRPAVGGPAVGTTPPLTPPPVRHRAGGGTDRVSGAAPRTPPTPAAPTHRG